MTEENKLYVPWSDKKEELEELTGDDEGGNYQESIKAKAWDRAEDQIFVFIMTIALM